MRRRSDAAVTVVSPSTAGAKTCQAQVIRKVDIECPINKTMAAAILGVSEDTLDQWAVKYGIEHYKYDMDGNTGHRGKVVYLASDILAFREQFRVEGRNIEREVELMMSDSQQ